jgi:hypothetical protein
MTFKNFSRTLRAFCRRQPFRPFLVEMVSGTVILVTHPEAIVLRGTLFVFTSPDDKRRVFESASVCELYDQPGADEGSA